MPKTPILFICLACVANGRRLHTPADQLQSRAGLGQEDLAALLLADGPRAAYSVLSPGANPPVAKPSQATSRLSTPASSPQIGGSRREALTLGGLAGLGALLMPDEVLARKIKVPPANLSESIVLILRVKEATEQETRLVKTGKYKELQRLDVSRAMKFMLYNYGLQDRFNQASKAAGKDQITAKTWGDRAVDALGTVIDYFGYTVNLKADELSTEQRTFILRAMESVSTSIDSFCDYMPPDLVKAAKAQVVEENRLNIAEYPEDEEMINVPDFQAIKKATSPKAAVAR